MIERDQARKFLDDIEKLWNEPPLNRLPGPVRDLAESKIMGEAMDELRRLVFESRPPVIFLLGRSGHGKSSLINALCGRQVAKVGHVGSVTPGSDPYHVSFNEGKNSWTLIDSRGLFESTSPDGGPAEDVVELTMEAVAEHKPDVIMHVISMPEVQNLSNDLRAFEQIMAKATTEAGHPIPTFMVLTKADTLGNPDEWPPGTFPGKAGLILKTLRYAAGRVLGSDLERTQSLSPDSPLHGYRLLQHPHCKAVIPVCALAGSSRLWNMGELHDFIGQQLPEDSQLDYYQGLGRKDLLRKVASRLTKRFSKFAALVGAGPLPVSDILVLSPLQSLLVVMIGGLSCRPVARSTFHEYLGAIGVVGAGGLGLRLAAQQLAKFIPVPGVAQIVSGGIAYAGTYGIGKSAETYFFSGEVKMPNEFTSELPVGADHEMNPSGPEATSPE